MQIVFLATEVSPVPFERFLCEHGRLLSAVPAWVVVVAHPGRLASAVSIWETAFRRFVEEDRSVTDARLRDLERYFVVRHAIERNELAGVSIADLQTFRARRLAFAEPAIEALFSRWVASGDSRLDPALVAGPTPGVGRLVVQALAHTYEQFGAYAGLV